MQKIAQTIEGEDIVVPGGATKVWAHHPNLPIPNSPVFRWPLRARNAFRWFAAGWLRISGATLWVALAFFTYYLLQPSLGVAQWPQFTGVLAMLVRNFLLILIVAGGLHWFLYIRRMQTDQLRFDSRPIARNNSKFTFNDQVLDNVFWSIAWGVPIWTAYEALYFWQFEVGNIPVLEFSSNPVLFVAMFWFVLLWKAIHFYWVHRLLHWPPYYKKVHSVHRRNINTVPWSGLSMHPLETLPYFSGVLIHFIVPSHPVHFLFHVYALALNPALSHSGFDALVISGKRRLETGEFFHQLHHRFFDCNYGTPEMPWDKWCGTYHDGTDEATECMRQKKKRGRSSE